MFHLSKSERHQAGLFGRDWSLLVFFFSFKGLLGLALSSPSPEGASMFLLGSYLKFLHKTPCM